MHAHAWTRLASHPQPAAAICGGSAQPALLRPRARRGPRATRGWLAIVLHASSTTLRRRRSAAQGQERPAGDLVLLIDHDRTAPPPPPPPGEDVRHRLIVRPRRVGVVGSEHGRMQPPTGRAVPKRKGLGMDVDRSTGPMPMPSHDRVRYVSYIDSARH